MERSLLKWASAKHLFERAAHLETDPLSKARCYWDRAALAFKTSDRVNAAYEAMPFLKLGLDAYPSHFFSLWSIARIYRILGEIEQFHIFQELAKKCDPRRPREPI